MSEAKPLTPMMQQYRSVHEKLPKDTVLFFRLGDFVATWLYLFVFCFQHCFSIVAMNNFWKWQKLAKSGRYRSNHCKRIHFFPAQMYLCYKSFRFSNFSPPKNNLDAPDKSSESGTVCERSSEVERYLAKVDVEGSNPFARSRFVK